MLIQQLITTKWRRSSCLPHLEPLPAGAGSILLPHGCWAAWWSSQSKKSDYIPVVLVIRSAHRNTPQAPAAYGLLLHNTWSAGSGGRGERESQTFSWWQQAVRLACLLTLEVSETLWKDCRILNWSVHTAKEVLASCGISHEALLGGVFHSGHCTEAFQHWHLFALNTVFPVVNCSANVRMKLGHASAKSK